MWQLKVLSGLHRNQSFNLQPGVNTLGRSADNSICLTDKGVSKCHAHIVVEPKGVKIVDQNSSNGSFVDGVQVAMQEVHPHNRLTFYNVLCQVLYQKTVAATDRLDPNYNEGGGNIQNPAMASFSADSASAGSGSVGSGLGDAADGVAGHVAGSVLGGGAAASAAAVSEEPQDLWQKAQLYLQAHVLPALYNLARWMDLKWVLALLVLAFVLFSTVLSSVPLLRTLKQSAENKVRIQAQSMAQQLASQNAVAISRTRHSDLQVASAQRQQGVQAAYIISSAGRVLAPAHLAGQHLNLDYVHTGRRLDRASSSKIKKGFLIALHPIKKLNPELQVNQVAAFAVVQIKSTAVPSGYVASLLIQNFFIILILGGLLFILIYCLIKYPVDKLNTQISESLQKNTNEIGFEYRFEALSELMTHIKSLLTRAQSATETDEAVVEVDRMAELTCLIESIENGALAVLDTEQIAMANPAFYNITQLQATDVENINLSEISDQALKLSLQDLIEQCKNTPSQPAHNMLEFNGVEYSIQAQAIFGTNSVAYYIVTFRAQGGE